MSAGVPARYPCRCNPSASRWTRSSPATRTTAAAQSRLRRRRSRIESPSWRNSLARRASGVDFPLPSREQALALCRRAEFRRVVADELDVGQIRYLRRQQDIAIGRDGEFLEIEADLLRFRRQRPVEEFFRVVRMSRALDDRHRPDFVTDTFARQDGFHRKSTLDLIDHAMQHGAADRGLPADDRAHRSDAGTRVLVDVDIERLQVSERFVLAENLYQRRQHQIAGAG